MTQLAADVFLVGKPGHVRDALAGVLSALAGASPVRCADTGLLALQAARVARPALVVILSSLPAVEIPALISEIKSIWKGVPCLLVTEQTERACASLCSGADKIIPTGISADTLINLVTQVLKS